jgi:hypothetical protein
MAQCREIQRLPLNFTRFMDGRELKGGWSQFAEDHDIHQGFFMTFNFHVGTSKFDVKIYDGTQCQKEYEAEVHFH